MKNLLKIILILTVLPACVDKKEGETKPTIASNFVSISDNEDKGVKEVLRYYDGLCEYSIGFEGKLNYFKLEMSECEYFRLFNNELEKSARNIALLFFKNLKEERKKYDEIRVNIILDSGSKKTFKITKDELLIVDENMKKVNRLVSYLKDGNYSAVDGMLSDQRFDKLTKEDFFIRMQEVDAHFGYISELMTSGYEIIHEGNSRTLHIEGTLIRSVQPSEFSVDIDLGANSDKILFFNYSK